MKKHIIFDLDGTLWNTLELCASAWNNVLDDFGYEKFLTSDDVKSIMGKTENEIMNSLFPDIKQNSIILKKCFRAHEDLISKEKMPLVYEGYQKIKDLSGKYNLSIISNCQKEYLQLFNLKYNTNELFDHTLCLNNPLGSKKENLSYLLSIHESVETYYVGDTPTDLIACKSLPIKFIGAGYGFGIFMNEKPIFNSLLEIINYFKYL